jgi:hypothetical protein
MTGKAKIPPQAEGLEISYQFIFPLLDFLFFALLLGRQMAQRLPPMTVLFVTVLILVVFSDGVLGFGAGNIPS